MQLIAVLAVLASAAILANPAAASSEELPFIDAQRNSLCRFYNFTEGHFWARDDNWCMEDEHIYYPCPSSNWWGVTCNGSTVTELRLPRNRLGGFIPECIVGLQELTALDLSENDLGGSFPDNWCSLEDLVEIDVSYNALDGPMPSCWGQMTRLEIFNVEKNALAGEIPAEIGAASALRVLDISDNKLSGPLVDELGELQNLQRLDVSWNDFTALSHRIGNLSELVALNIKGNLVRGSLPEWIGGLQKLRELDMSRNFFHGPLPSSWRGAESLVELDVSFNDLSGTLPSWISVFGELKLLWLQENDFNGTIPSEIGELSELESFSFAQNRFGGELPESIAKLTKLRRLFGFSNNVTHIPDVFHAKMSLEEIGFYDNGITGTLPSSLLHLDELSVLWMHYNSFEGRPPTFFQPSLTSVMLNRNRLEGPLSEVADFAALVNLEELRLNFNLFSGTIPAELFHESTKFVTLSANRVNGTLPKAMETARDLTEFEVELNELSGNIDVDFRVFKSLRRLALSGNNFTGPLPDLPLRSPIEYLYLEDNQFTGTIPSSLMELTHVQEVGLGDNLLSGPLPEPDFAMTALRVMSLNDNQLNGTIPNTLAYLPFLTELSLRNNNFTGEIPFEFGIPFVPNPEDCGELSELHVQLGRHCFWFNTRTIAVLDFSGNDLEGEMPESVFEISPLYYVSVQDNPRMRDANGWPVFPVKPAFSAGFGNYSCRPLDISTGTFLFDNAYYDYNLCRCNPGFFGHPPDNCHACYHGAHCPGGELIEIPHGMYPVCEPGSCDDVGSELVGLDHCHEEEQCIPDLPCTYVPGSGLDEHCELCEEGYSGRLCSHCKDGYYHRGESCFKCSGFHLAWFLPMFIGGWLFTAVAAATDYHMTHLIGEAAVVTLLWMINAVPVWLMYFIFIVLIAQVLNMIGYLILRLIRRYRAKASGVEEKKRHNEMHIFSLSPGAIEALLFYLQAQEAFELALELHGGDWDPLNINQYQIGGPECYSSFFDVYGRFLLVMSIPIAVCITLLVVYLIGVGFIVGARRVRRRRRNRNKRLQSAAEMEGLVASGYDDDAPDEMEEDEYDDEEEDEEYDDDDDDDGDETSAYGRPRPESQVSTSGLFYGQDPDPHHPKKKKTGAIEKWGNRVLRSFLLLTTILYFEISKNIFEMFACVPDELDPDTYYMEHAPYIQCYTYNIENYDHPEWSWIFYTAVVCFIVYTVGIPLLWFVLLAYARLRHRLHDKVTISRIGYLYEDYREGLWLWIFVTTARLLLLVAFAAVLISTNPWQPALMFTVLAIGLATQATFQPYHSKLDNWLCTWIILASTIQYMFVFFSQSNLGEYSEPDGMDVVVVILDVLSLLAILRALTAPLFRLGAKMFCEVKKEVQLRTSGSSAAGPDDTDYDFHTG